MPARAKNLAGSQRTSWMSWEMPVISDTQQVEELQNKTSPSKKSETVSENK
jgi:hypothetical protein